MRPHSVILQVAGCVSAAGLLTLQVSVAQDQLAPKRSEIDTHCVACVSASGAQAPSGISYRGHLDGEGGTLAVLTRDGREQVVAVGDTLDGSWNVIAIDEQAVTLRHVVVGVQQRLWFGGAIGQMGPEGPPQRRAPSRLTWRAPSTVQLGDEFSIVLFVRGIEVNSGTITLAYDPDVLKVVDATGNWENHQGHTRLQVSDVSDGDNLAEVEFRVVARNPTVTRVRVDRMDLVGVASEAVAALIGDDVRINVLPRASPGWQLR